MLREELQVLQEPGSYVGEVVKVMGKKKVLVKVQPEGKYGTSPSSMGFLSLQDPIWRESSAYFSRRLLSRHPHCFPHAQSACSASIRFLPPALYLAEQDRSPRLAHDGRKSP